MCFKKTYFLMFVAILFFFIASCGTNRKYKNSAYWKDGNLQQPNIGVRSKSVITIDKFQFKDSDGDGELDQYEDWRLSPTERAGDLVTKMEVDQKTALLELGAFLGGPSDNKGTVKDEIEEKIRDSNVRFTCTRWSYDGDAEAYALYRNACQEIAEEEPLSIPIIFVTDPVHDSGSDASSSKLNVKNAKALTPFPMPLGFGAIGSTDIVKEIAKIQKEEFRATGVLMQYGPICDLATEPMWARIPHTFGPDGETTGKFTKAYIQGLQGKDDGVDVFTGVAATLKHFPGGGANEGGLDSHREWGRFNVYPGNNFEDHLKAMKIALEANPACLMPCYSVFKTSYKGKELENVPAAYSKTIMMDILRDELGWDGFVTSDWNAVDGADTAGLMGMAWEDVWDTTIADRVAMWISTGVHQIGNGDLTKWQAGLNEGTITEADLDKGVIKALEVMFKVGAFENPYVDPSKANAIVESHAKIAEEIMQQAITLLKNEGNSILPLTSDSVDNGIGDDKIQVYYDGYDDDAIDSYIDSVNGFQKVSDVAQADYAIVRISARQGIYFAGDGAVPLTWDDPIKVYDHATGDPSGVDSTDKGFFGMSVEANNKAYKEVAEKLKSVIASKGAGTKLILCVYMDRPFIIEPYLPDIDALVVDFSATDNALLNILYQMKDGKHDTSINPTGKLPMSIPKSQQDVYDQVEDLPNDEKNKTFVEGTGLSY